MAVKTDRVVIIIIVMLPGRYDSLMTTLVVVVVVVVVACRPVLSVPLVWNNFVLLPATFSDLALEISG